jgi:hypothetical protein
VTSVKGFVEQRTGSLRVLELLLPQGEVTNILGSNQGTECSLCVDFDTGFGRIKESGSFSSTGIRGNHCHDVIAASPSVG